MKKTALIVGMVLAGVAIFGATLLLHLGSELGRRAVGDLMAWQASRGSRGEVRVGGIDHLSFDRMVMRDYQVLTKDGQTVIRTDRIVGDPDPWALFEGRIHLKDVRFEGAEVRLTRGPGGQIALIHASEVPDGRSSMKVVMEGIDLVDNTILVDLPGKPQLRMTGVSGQAHLEIGHQYLWRLDQTSGTVNGIPVLGEASFSGMHGRLKSDHAMPLIVEMTVDVAVAEPVVKLTYEVPAIGGGEGEPYLDLDLPDGIFAGGDRDSDDQGPPAGGGTRDGADGSGEDSDEDFDERVDEEIDL